MAQLDDDHGKIHWNQRHGVEARVVSGVMSQDDIWFHYGTGLPWKGGPWDPLLRSPLPGRAGGAVIKPSFSKFCRAAGTGPLQAQALLAVLTQ